MERLFFCFSILALLASLGGCVSSRATGRALAEQSVSDLCSDDGFQENYRVFVDQQNRRPLVRVGVIRNESAEQRYGMLASMRDHLMAYLGATRLFELLADESMDAVPGGGIPVPASSEDSADYLMQGRYREFQDGNRQFRELSLQLIDLHDGRQIWNGIAEIERK